MLHPRKTLILHGHEAAEQTLMDAWRSERMPHAWLLSGEQGIGKATLAYRFARMVLEAPPGSPAATRIAAGSHTDLLTVEPEFDEKKDEAKREITVEQSRAISAFLALTPGEGSWRVAIVDSADALNVNAANAILKIVEEPPPRGLLLLISHNPGRLLPTLRSRCRPLKLAQLPSEAFMRIIQPLAPEQSEADLSTLGRLSGYTPGAALEWLALDGLEINAMLCALMQALPTPPLEDIMALATRVSADKTHARWQVLSRLLLRLLALAAVPDRMTTEEKAAVAAMHRLWPPKAWAARHAEAALQFSLAARLHLDYKTVLTAFFHSLPQALVPWNRAIST